jgi:hypothetical protein
VFFYEHTAGAGKAIDLAQDFEAAIVNGINAIQCGVVKNRTLDILNMGDPTDFVYYPITGQGDIVGQALPPQSAVSYTLKLNTRAVRKGGHRISGIPEAVQDSGVISDPTYITAIEALRDLFVGELVNVSDTWLPVVLKRVKEPVVGTVPLQYTYRLPSTDAELVVGEIVTGLVNTDVGNQVSRKR